MYIVIYCIKGEFSQENNGYFFFPSEKGQLSSKEVKIGLIAKNKKELPLPEISKGSKLETWELQCQHRPVTLETSEPEWRGDI